MAQPINSGVSTKNLVWEEELGFTLLSGERVKSALSSFLLQMEVIWTEKKDGQIKEREKFQLFNTLVMSAVDKKLWNYNCSCKGPCEVKFNHFNARFFFLFSRAFSVFPRSKANCNAFPIWRPKPSIELQ